MAADRTLREAFLSKFRRKASEEIAQATSGMETRVIGEAAEAAAKGANNVEEITRKEASNRWSFYMDGNHYYRQVRTKARVDANGNIMKDADGNVIRERVGTDYYIDSPIGKQTISGEEYGRERRRWLNSLPEELPQPVVLEATTETASEVAQKTAESGAGFLDGIPGWAKGVGIGAASFVAGGIILDDDEY